MIDNVVGFFQDFGAIGLFIHSFVDAIIFPIPAFFLQVSLSIMDPSSAIWLATVGYIACLLGTPFGYWIGLKLGETVLHKIVNKKWIDKASQLFQKNGEAAILIGAFTPIPFKVFTILSGCVKFSLWKLMGYAALGRAVKFYAVGIIFYLFGRSSEQFILTYMTPIFGVVAIILFVIFYVKRQIEKRKKAVEKTEEKKKKESLSS